MECDIHQRQSNKNMHMHTINLLSLRWNPRIKSLSLEPLESQ